jgi:hypothetical protein
MFIQKVFHIHQSVEETRKRLANIHAYRHRLNGVHKAMLSAEGIGQFEFSIRPGCTVSAELAEVADTADRVLFQSAGGNVRLQGAVEFFEIKKNLTEIVLTLEYSLHSAMHRALDRLTGGMDRFLNSQLERLQMHFDGIHADRVAAEIPTAFSAQATPAPHFA